MVHGPIGRCRNALLVRQLQGLDTTDNLVHVASHTGGVIQTQHEFIFGVDDKDGPNGEGQILLIGRARVQHAKGRTDTAIGVSDNGELDFNVVFAVSDHVREPVGVGFDGIDRESGDEAVHGLEFVVFEGEASNFSRTDGGEVGCGVWGLQLIECEMAITIQDN